MTRSLRVETDPAYLVHVGAGVLSEVAGHTDCYSKVAVLVDATVEALHLERLGALAEAPVISIQPGEASKSFATLERVHEDLARLQLDREGCLVALGGGVLGDLTGLAAALYKRGIDFVQCPTTLLAQVDASVGGKTAVNLKSGKNLAGAFHQPRAVFADMATLETLPEQEFVSGLGEVLKSALLSGEGDLAALEALASKLRAREPEATEQVVLRSAALKARVVAADPLEQGPRKQLNLGHTFGHAIELCAGYGRVPHGVAVAAGIAMALRQAAESSLLEDADLPERVAQLAQALGLPSSLADLESRYGLTLSAPDLFAAMASDKKNSGGQVLLVLPKRAGEMHLDVGFTGP